MNYFINMMLIPTAIAAVFAVGYRTGLMAKIKPVSLKVDAAGGLTVSGSNISIEKSSFGCNVGLSKGLEIDSTPREAIDGMISKLTDEK